MILFLEDWDNYPTAEPDLKTRNQSFVRLSSLYRSMGIKNHAFPLALINQDLIGIDTLSPYLSKTEQMMISIECKLNPWYFMREVFMVPANSGAPAMMVEANRGNVAAWWCFFNHIMILMIQPRQTGKSLNIDGLIVLLLNLLCKDTQINLLTKDDGLRSKNLKRIKDIEDMLPPYLKQRTKRDIANTEELLISSLNNGIKGHVPQASPKAAEKAARGYTSPIFVIDEAPFQANIEISMPAALSAGTAAREKAAFAGEPYGTILTTTSGSKDDRDGKHVYKHMIDSADWSEHYLDSKNVTELEEMVRKHSRGGFFRMNIIMNHKQLGKDDAWLLKALEDSTSTGDAANKDYFNLWTSGTESSPLSKEALQKIRDSQRAPDFESISGKKGFIVRWYIPERDVEQRLATGKFIMVLDTSDASGGDDISLLIIDVENFDTIAAGTYNNLNLIDFAEWIAYDWIIKYENITTLFERRSSAIAILDAVIRILLSVGVDPFTRLFNRVVNDSDEDPKRFKDMCLLPVYKKTEYCTTNKKTFGFATSGSGMGNRSDLYGDRLREAAKVVGYKVSDRTTIDQITGLINKGGRVDHQPGAHDDLVIAWVLAYWFCTKAKNLSHYGIDTKKLLSGLRVIKIESDVDYYEQERQHQHRLEVEEIYNQLQNEKDERVVSNLERRMRHLNSLIVLRDDETFSVEELINKLHEQRRSRLSVMKLRDNRDYYGRGSLYYQERNDRDPSAVYSY